MPTLTVQAQRLAGRLLAAVCLLLFFYLALTTALAKTPTNDEPAHLLRGFALSQTGDLRFQFEHAPLSHRLIGSLLFSETQAPEVRKLPLWETGDRLQIAEYYLIGNTGERTYIGAGQGDGDERTTVAFTVPQAAMGLTFDGPGLGERFVGDATSFADTLPIPPGTATIEVDFSYELTYEEGLELTRELNVPVQSVVIIVNGSEIGLEGPGVEFGGMMDTQMGRAASYTAGPYTAGVPLVLSFVPQDSAIAASVEAETRVDTPAETSGPRQRDPGSEMLIGGVVLVVAAFVAYQVWQAQPIPPMPGGARDTVADIVALDERYADGDLTVQNYERRRAALKRKARSYLPRGH